MKIELIFSNENSQVVTVSRVPAAGEFITLVTDPHLFEVRKVQHLADAYDDDVQAVVTVIGGCTSGLYVEKKLF